jgi:putative addiction module component (TIGR02574 family)
MTETAERLKLELSQLSAEDRAELACFLIHSLDEDTENDAEDAWDSELAKRMKEIEGGAAQGESASNVISNLQNKYS